MINITDPKKCCGCSACVDKCPKRCIFMIADNQGFKYPKVDLDLCINCHLCEKVCPELHIQQSAQTRTAYAYTNDDNRILLSSSSGGFFYQIAKYILTQKGIVFGASFDKEFNVEHKYITQLSDIAKLQGSKYVQSNLYGTYKEIEKSVKQGKLVLFTGTPCQIAGLTSFLDRDYDNLIKLSVACHGVPSEKIWQLWLKGKFKGKYHIISNIIFRWKNPSWENYSMRVEFRGDSYNIIPSNKNSFMKAFLDGLIMRPSCTECQLKLNSTADITMADFWGVLNVYPEFYNKDGVSLIISHSAKGDETLRQMNISPLHPVDYDKAVKYNSSLMNSAKSHDEFNTFFAIEDNKKFNFLEHKYNKSIIEKIIGQLFHKS